MLRLPVRRFVLIAAGALLATLLLATSLAARPALAAPPAAPPGQAATPTPEPQPIESDQQCLDCHTQPDQVMTLPSGETLYLTMDEAGFAASVHGQNEVGCRDCHAEVTTYPHAPLAAQNLRQVAGEFSQTCQNCHEAETERQMDSIHAQLRAEGNEAAAVCADCHNPHYFQEVAPRSQIVATCNTCHSGIGQEYRQSVHGAALVAEENGDVPLCIDCHGVHAIQDPRTGAFLSQSPQLCARCHADEEKMAPYGLNTDVLNTYVADFHGTTVQLFQQQTPDQAPNTPLCIDCHGIHNIKAVDDATSSVMQANLLATCQKCHPDATANFPAAWLSHYTPSPEHYPLVYYVNTFYKFFIPAVLGGMALFVATDAGRRLVTRARHGRHGGK